MMRTAIALLLVLATPAFAAVPSTTSRAESTASGAAITFTFTFPVTTSASHVEVYLKANNSGATWVKQVAGYTVALNPNQASAPGGSVVFAVAPANGTAVRIQRAVPLTQETVFTPHSAFPAKTTEKALDRLVFQAQQVDRRVADAEATHAADKSAQAAKDLSQDNALANVGTGVATGDSLITATGATQARPLKDIAADVLNVKSFGAVGDGVTDDTAAIQAALDAGARAVFAPPGTYAVTLIEVPTGVDFSGAGPTLTVIKGAIRNKLGAAYDQYHGSIRKLSVDGVNKLANGIDLLRPWYWHLQDVDIYNCLVGLRLRQAIVNTFVNVRVHDNVVGFQAGAGMTSWADPTPNALPTTINTFVSLNAFNNDEEGLRIQEAKALQFSGGAIETNAKTGAVPYNVTLTHAANTREMAIFDGVWFEGGPVDAHVHINANPFAKAAVFNDCGFVPKGIAGNVKRAIVANAGLAEVNGANWQSDVFQQIAGSSAPFQVNRANGGKVLYRGTLPKTDATDTTVGIIEDEAHDKTNIDGYAQAHIIDQADSRFYGRTIQYVRQGQVAWQVRQDDGAGAWRAHPHFDVVNDGRVRWGPGTGAVDTQLSRSAADTLSMGTGDSFKVDGTWNGGRHLLGAYHLWVDATGKLRIKSGAPANDTDGTVVGQQ